MRRYILIVLCVFVGCFAHGQGSMNIHLSYDNVFVKGLSTMDSVRFLPSLQQMRIYYTNGNISPFTFGEVDSLSYSPAGPEGSPLLATQSPRHVTGMSAQMEAYVEEEFGATITARGICWSTSPEPTTADQITLNGTGTGRFPVMLFGLAAGTTYYARAYATNAAGTAYGNQVSFTTLGEATGNWLDGASIYGMVTDIEGNAYATVVIGEQEWMAENLRTAHYANGDPITQVNDPDEWFGPVSEKWCHYDTLPGFDLPYGKLYNWAVVSDPRNVCPSGWHVPTDEEWYALENHIDPFIDDPLATGPRGVYGGNVLKTAGATYWEQPENASNAVGFSALPAGTRLLFGDFLTLHEAAHWWTSSMLDATYPCSRTIWAGEGTIERHATDLKGGNSVRCIRD
ncbi:MAG TPA: fibrobacter succinogenes major paralogous domain-containing protein [Flavobacteriales bacterium]|nr:fibrobacter succinogenes major paralogous domain-containing protein [Flavobacteriales bacterium]